MKTNVNQIFKIESFIWCFLFVIPQYAVIAQEAKNEISFQKLLSHIENKYDIRFSFMTKQISKITLSNIDFNASLKQLLEEINKQTLVFVEKIDERYYVIRNKTEEGKITLCGTLVNPFTQKTISDARIFNSSSREQVFSDEAGSFILYLANPSDQISINALGYKIEYYKAHELQDASCPDIPMYEQSNELDEVLISDYLKNDLDKIGNDGNFSLNPNKLGLIAGLTEPDIFETLQILPGVQGVSESASELLIRGGNPDQNLILLDGIRLYNLSHLFGAFSIVNPYITENIELYRGDGVNPKYGGALGGIISIRSISKIPEKTTGSFGTTLVNSDINVSAPIGKNIAIVASARSSINALFENDTFVNYLARATQNIQFESQALNIVNNTEVISNSFNFYDFSLKVISKPSQKNKINLTSFYNSNSITTRYTDSEFPNFMLDWEGTKTSIGIGTSWEHKLSDKLTTSIAGSFSGFDENINTSRTNEEDNGDIVTNASDIATYNIEDFSAEGSLIWKPDQKYTINAGYQFSDISMSSENQERNSDYFGKRVNQTHTLYSNLQFQFKSFVATDLGIRTSRFSILQNNKIYVEPRLSLRLKFNDHFKIRMSYAVNTQAIHQLSYLTSISFPIESNPWVLLQPTIYNDPLQNQQWSLGFLFSKKTWDINLDFYAKKTTNINTGIRGFQQINAPRLGSSSTKGADLLIKKKIRNYRSIITYSFMDQDFKFEGLNQNRSFSGNFDTTHSFTWSHMIKYKWLSFALRWNYRTGTPFSSIIGDEDHVDIDSNLIINTEDLLNTERLKAYHRLDFSSTFEFTLSKKRKLYGKLILSALNLYDRKNELGIYYDHNTQGTDSPEDKQIFTTKSLGLTTNLALRIMF